MVTDRWPDEEGYIVEGIVIGFCEAGNTLTANRGCARGTAATGKIVVTTPAGVGDSVGVALKAASAGEKVPVAFSGVIKMVSTGTFNAGEFITGGAAGRAKCGQAAANTSSLNLFKAAGSTGSYILGMALQTAAAEGDECLILLGKCV